MESFRNQAIKFGAVMLQEDVKEVNFSEHPYSISLHFLVRGHGLHGACGFYHGPGDAYLGTSREIVHPHGDGVRLQHAGDHGHTSPRE